MTHLARFRRLYNGWTVFSIVRRGLLSRKIGGPAPVDWQRAPGVFVVMVSRVIFFLPFPGWRPCEQKFSGYGESVENSFPNRPLPGWSCIVLPCADLLERPHENTLSRSEA
jgi:hypothetical protein